MCAWHGLTSISADKINRSLGYAADQDAVCPPDRELIELHVEARSVESIATEPDTIQTPPEITTVEEQQDESLQYSGESEANERRNTSRWENTPGEEGATREAAQEDGNCDKIAKDCVEPESRCKGIVSIYPSVFHR